MQRPRLASSPSRGELTSTATRKIFRSCLVLGMGFAASGVLYSSSLWTERHHLHSTATTAPSTSETRWSSLGTPGENVDVFSSTDPPVNRAQHSFHRHRKNADPETQRKRRDIEVDKQVEEVGESEHFITKKSDEDRNFEKTNKSSTSHRAPANSEATTTTKGNDAITTTTVTTATEVAPPAPVPLYPVRVLRIPKAGSSSFSAFLRLQYGCVTEQHPAGDCTKKNRWYCLEIEGCSNHWPPPDWQGQAARGERVEPMITMIRDPVARYISAFDYPGHHGKGLNGNITAHTLLFPEYDNTQVNYLSRNPIGTWGRGQGNKNNQARTVRPDPTQLVSPEEMEARLQETLDLMDSEHLHFVGLVERYHDSLRLFCRIYQCPYLEESLNVSPIRKRGGDSGYAEGYDPRQDPVALQAIRQSNVLDYRLYHAAEARFCREARRFQADAAFVASLTKDTRRLCGMENSSSSSTAQTQHGPQPATAEILR